MNDFIGIFLWLLGGIAVFVALIGLFKLLAWWLARNPGIARVFTVVFGGFAGAAIAGVAAAVFTFLKYSFRGGAQILGMDRGALVILIASFLGFVAGALIAHFFARRLPCKTE
jgi:hypothetical protein